MWFSGASPPSANASAARQPPRLTLEAALERAAKTHASPEDEEAAVGALLDAGVSEIRLINRTGAKAQDLADAFGARVRVFGWAQIGQALVGAGCVINATSLGLGGHDPLEISLDGLAPGSVVMDMVYRPLRTAFLQRAEVAGLVTVDGLAMLVGQAVPSFEAFFGQSPPPQVDVRALALQALEAQP